MCHPTDLVIILKEGSMCPSQQDVTCVACKPPAEALSKGHTQMELGRDFRAPKQQVTAGRDSQCALKMWFTAYDEKLE